jgi:hypothetical protein
LIGKFTVVAMSTPPKTTPRRPNKPLPNSSFGNLGGGRALSHPEIMVTSGKEATIELPAMKATMPMAKEVVAFVHICDKISTAQLKLQSINFSMPDRRKAAGPLTGAIATSSVITVLLMLCLSSETEFPAGSKMHGGDIVPTQGAAACRWIVVHTVHLGVLSSAIIVPLQSLHGQLSSSLY